MINKQSSNIEAMRFLATFLLVSYHAIGPTAQGALEINYPHFLRFFADFFIDVRMPVFGFISGWVYALRPVASGTLNAYSVGKFRRLIIPGLVAALVHWGISNFIITSSASDVSIWNVVTLSFIHYWFLQAIFILLIVIGSVEAISRRLLPSQILIACILILLLLPRYKVPYFELDGAIYLGPFFFFGVLISRQAETLQRNRRAILGAAFAGLVIATVMSVLNYAETGILPRGRKDLQSAFMAFASITLLYMLLPKLRIPAILSAASFTIYLYHDLGTSGARRVAQAMGLESVWLILAIACVVGFLLPIAAHLVFSRFAFTRVLCLGLKAR